MLGGGRGLGGGSRLQQLGSPEAGWRVPIDGARAWRTVYVIGAGEDASFPLAILRASGAADVHVFTHEHVSAPVAEARTPRLHLRGEPVHVGAAMRRRQHARLDLLAVHASAPVGDIVGELVRDQLDVGLLCIATAGPATSYGVTELWAEMQGAGYRLADASGGARGWRMVFARVSPPAA